MVSKRLSVIWKQNIVSSCNGFLKAAQDLIEHLESKYTSEIQGSEAIFNRQAVVLPI